MERQQCIGIEIGGTKLQLAAGTSQEYQIVREDIDPAKGAEGIRMQILRLMEQLLQQKEIAAIGVGFGGPVSWQTGVIQTSHQVNGWNKFPLKEWLEQKSGVPVVIDNDANVAALGEATQGAGKGWDKVFYMTIGSGIGGGMITDGRIYHGRLPGEVEIGHLRLDKSGATVESKCSGWAVNEKIRAFAAQHPNTLLASAAREAAGHEARALGPALGKEDPDAQKIITEIADDLSFSLAHVVHLFNPDVMVMGGGLSLLKDHLLKPLEHFLPKYIMKALLPPPPLYLARLGENAVPVGALELARLRAGRMK